MKREKRDLWRLAAAVQQAPKKTDVRRIIDELLAFNKKERSKDDEEEKESTMD